MGESDWRANSRANRQRAAGAATPPPSPATLAAVVPAAAPITVPTPSSETAPGASVGGMQAATAGETARTALGRLATAAGQKNRLLLLVVGGVLSAVVTAVSMATTGADEFAVLLGEWPVSVPVLLGAGWGLYAGQNAPAWPDRLLLVCVGIVGCMSIALTAAGLSIGFTLLAMEFAISAFLEPRAMLREVGGAPLSLPLYIAACWGLAAALLWKGAQRARFVAAASGLLLLAAGVGSPAWAQPSASFVAEHWRMDDIVERLERADRHAEARETLQRFILANPNVFGFSLRELNPSPALPVGQQPTEGAIRYYLKQRFLVANPVSAQWVVATTSGLYGDPLLSCIAAVWDAEQGTEARRLRGRARRQVQNHPDCQTARARFPDNVTVREVYSAPPRPVAAAPVPPALQALPPVAQVPAPPSPNPLPMAAAPAVPATRPSPAPASPPAAAAPRPSPPPMAAPASRPAFAQTTTAWGLESWRIFDMVTIGAGMLLCLGLWLRRTGARKGA
jgi:hypothetical protein